MKQKIIIALVIFGLGLLGSGVGGLVIGYVRGAIAESRIEAMSAQLSKICEVQDSLPEKYVPRKEYEKDYQRLLRGLETLDGKMDKLLRREK